MIILILNKIKGLKSYLPQCLIIYLGLMFYKHKFTPRIFPVLGNKDNIQLPNPKTTNYLLIRQTLFKLRLYFAEILHDRSLLSSEGYI